MYPPASNVHYAQSQPHTHLQSDPAFHTLTQPLVVHQPYAQRAEIHAAQTCDYLPPPTKTHALPTEQHTPNPHPTTGKQSTGKDTGMQRIVNPQALQRPTTGSVKPYTQTIDSALLWTKPRKTHTHKALTQSPHPFSSPVL